MMSEIDVGSSSSKANAGSSSSSRFDVITDDDLAEEILRSGSNADNDKSSSTEGPDSPGQSSNCSPIPMIMPASPYRAGAVARGGRSMAAGGMGGAAAAAEEFNTVTLPR